MSRPLRLSLSVSIGLVIVAVATLGRPLPASGQTSARNGSVSLRPGVLIDPEKSVVYAMSAATGIDAIDLLSGRVIWHSNQATKPLQIAEGILVAQAERDQSRAANAPNGFQVVMLDARDGRKRLAIPVSLPDGAWAAIDDGPGSSLKTTATVQQGDVIVSWSTETREVGGIAPGRQSSQTADDTRLLSQRQSTQGSVRISLQSGRTRPAGPGAPPAQLSSRADVPEQMRLTNLLADQYLSADGAHVLVSEQIGDDSTWEKYRWAIHLISTGERVGEMTNYFPRAAFFMSGHILVYQSQPFSWRLADGRLNREPLKLHAINLQNGGELWASAVRDTAYRGPFPP